MDLFGHNAHKRIQDVAKDINTIIEKGDNMKIELLNIPELPYRIRNTHVVESKMRQAVLGDWVLNSGDIWCEWTSQQPSFSKYVVAGQKQLKGLDFIAQLPNMCVVNYGGCNYLRTPGAFFLIVYNNCHLRAFVDGDGTWQYIPSYKHGFYDSDSMCESNTKVYTWIEQDSKKKKENQ